MNENRKVSPLLRIILINLNTLLLTLMTLVSSLPIYLFIYFVQTLSKFLKFFYLLGTMPSSNHSIKLKPIPVVNQ